MCYLKSYLKSESGTSAIEFAMLSPIFILLLIGTVNFGFFVTERMKLQELATTAADYVASAETDANIQVIAEEAYNGSFGDVNLTSEFSCQCSEGVILACPADCGSSDYQRRFVDVTASGVFNPLIPFPGMPDDMSLQSTVRLRVN